METLICPFTEARVIYKNWVEQTNIKRLDIITIRREFPRYHGCIALEAIKDSISEGGVLKNKELEERLKTEEINCSYIMLLDRI